MSVGSSARRRKRPRLRLARLREAPRDQARGDAGRDGGAQARLREALGEERQDAARAASAAHSRGGRRSPHRAGIAPRREDRHGGEERARSRGAQEVHAVRRHRLSQRRHRQALGDLLVRAGVLPTHHPHARGRRVSLRRMRHHRARARPLGREDTIRFELRRPPRRLEVPCRHSAPPTRAIVRAHRNARRPKHDE